MCNLRCRCSKTRQDNDVTDRIGLVYVENNIEFSEPIIQGAICDETKQDNDVIDHIGLVYNQNGTELSEPIGSGAIYDETR